MWILLSSVWLGQATGAVAASGPAAPVAVASVSAASLLETAAIEHSQERLDFAQVVQRSLAANPLTPAQAAALRGAQGQLWQAGRRPNPSLNLSAEDITGSGPYSGLERSEVTLSWQQRLERGGKRAARVQLAKADEALLAAQTQLDLVALVGQIEVEYRQLQAAQARLLAQQEQTHRAQTLRDIVAERQQRGRDSDLALDQAELHLARAHSLQMQSQGELERSWQRLQSRWQEHAGPVVLADVMGTGGVNWAYLEQDSFNHTPVAAAQAEWPGAAAADPQRQWWHWQQQRARARLALERAQAKQDPTVSAGLRYLQDSQDVSLVLGVSLPIGLWDRNQGNIHSAAAQAEQSEWQAQAQEWQRQREWRSYLAQAQQAAHQAEDIEQRLLPKARSAEQRVLQRRAQGAASDVDVYTAQRLAEELGLQLIEARERYHLAMAAARSLAADAFRQHPEWFTPPEVAPFDIANTAEE